MCMMAPLAAAAGFKPITEIGDRLNQYGVSPLLDRERKRYRKGKPTRVTYEYGDSSGKTDKPMGTKKDKPVTQPETTDTYAR